MVKTTVNKAKCIGSGDCVETAPKVFAFDDKGKSEVINSNRLGGPGNRLRGAQLSGEGDHGGRRGHGRATLSATAEKITQI